MCLFIAYLITVDRRADAAESALFRSRVLGLTIFRLFAKPLDGVSVLTTSYGTLEVSSLPGVSCMPGTGCVGAIRTGSLLISFGTTEAMAIGTTDCVICANVTAPA